MTRSVRALRLIAHGAPLRLEEVTLPEPGPGEVVVDLAAAGVNPVDRYGALGLVAADGPLPRTLGAEATGWLDGKPVLVHGGGLGSQRDGVWAEAVVAQRDDVVPLDPSLNMTAAAGLGIVGITAWNVVAEVGKVTSADRVLVLGAGGGVGLSVISLALSAGATVMGQVGSPAKREMVRAFGAQPVVADASALADAARDFAPTIIFDPLGGDFTSAALSVLVSKGRHVVYGTSAGTSAALELRSLYRASQSLLGYGGLGLSDTERREGARAAAAAMAAGSLRIHVGRVLPLSEAAGHPGVLASITDRSLAGKLILDCRG